MIEIIYNLGFSIFLLFILHINYQINYIYPIKMTGSTNYYKIEKISLHATVTKSRQNTLGKHKNYTYYEYVFDEIVKNTDELEIQNKNFSFKFRTIRMSDFIKFYSPRFWKVSGSNLESKSCSNVESESEFEDEVDEECENPLIEFTFAS